MSKSEVTRKGKKIYYQSSLPQNSRGSFLLLYKYMYGTENVEIQPFKCIFNFSLNISSYVKIYFSEPSIYKAKKETHFTDYTSNPFSGLLG